MAKAFVSHSSRNDPFAAEVRDAVKDGLHGYEVFVDMDALQSGDDWSCIIYHWLAKCHAAVILLNREALTSPWVRREVNVLLWRRALGAPVRIVPAVLGDLTPEDVKKAGLSELESLQFAQLTSTAGVNAARELAAKITERFTGHVVALDDSPMGEWTNVVATYLQEVKNLDSLEAAARSSEWMSAT
jgi:TIR domain